MEYRDDYEYIGIIELENGDYFHVVKYATENGFYLDAGTATNTCFYHHIGLNVIMMIILMSHYLSCMKELLKARR